MKKLALIIRKQLVKLLAYAFGLLALLAAGSAAVVYGLSQVLAALFIVAAAFPAIMAVGLGVTALCMTVEPGPELDRIA